MTLPAPAPLSVFISYSHRDEDFKDDLVIHLANLKRQGKIHAWQDRDIEAGAEWDAEIQQQLEAAEIILLLITPRFLASDYCFDLEMQRAVERHSEGTARVIPIIVKPCDWQGTPFSKLQVVPKDAKPITKWDDPDDAFLNVVQGIRRAVESLHAKKPQGETPSPPTVSPVTVFPAAAAPSAPLPPSPPRFSTYNPATFVGREAETAQLMALLQGSDRILAIVGMTGIGKTALAECVVVNLMETPHPKSLSQSGRGTLNPAPLLLGEKGPGDEGYYRLSLDDRSLTPDFSSSGAALLRTLGDEPSLADQQDPANLVAHILSRLCSHPCRVQIDSLERLLRGNEQEGWSEFCDPLWLDLLQKFLAGTDCRSQLILTSQDIPGDLDTVASRYPQFWHCEPLQGLNPAEQRTLFQNLGLTPTDAEWELLERIGAFYDGHPLVLQVIAEEIRQSPFHSNVRQYWHHYQAEFTPTVAPTAHTLDRSRLFRRRVRQRVEQTIQRLPTPTRQMLCASAVFRRPVPIEFWHAMLPNGDANAAFDTLQDRHLVEYAPMQEAGGSATLTPRSATLTPQSASGEGTHKAPTTPPTSGERSRTTAPFLIRQHNLIRAVALTLLKADTPTWQAAERQAAELWLHNYQPAPDAPNIETVRGYLEAFDHYCEAGDWEKACSVLDIQIDSPTKEALHWQLETWGYYQEEIRLYEKVVGKTSTERDILWFRGFGIAYDQLGNAVRAIEYHQQSLRLARSVEDKSSEAKALGNLGLAYRNLGRYEDAIDHHQQHLTIARQIGDRLGQGAVLGNMGIAYRSLGRYEEAIDHHQQYLTIAREIGYSKGEGIALGNLGITYYSLGRYEEAIDHQQQRLTIAREIGNRRGECHALGNLGLVYYDLGRYEEAISHHEQALMISQEIGDRQGEGADLGNLGLVYEKLGDYTQAADYAKQHLKIAREIGDRRGGGAGLRELGVALLRQQSFAEALENLQSALIIFQEVKSRSDEAVALKNLAELHHALGEIEIAQDYCQQALALATELGIPLKAECEALLSKLEQSEISYAGESVIENAQEN